MAPPKSYRVLVTGSRDWQYAEWVDRMLAHIHADWSWMTVVHGGAKGADVMADQWARRNGVGVEVHHANWNRYGKAAGPQRNIEMVLSGADVCLALIRNRSAGATHCASIAAASRVPLVVVRDNDAATAASPLADYLLPGAYAFGEPNVTEYTVDRRPW